MGMVPNRKYCRFKNLNSYKISETVACIAVKDIELTLCKLDVGFLHIILLLEQHFRIFLMGYSSWITMLLSSVYLACCSSRGIG